MEKRCYNCMELLEENEVCSKCGFRGETEQENTELKAGSLLKGRYYVGNIFSKTIDSTVFIAFDTQLNKKVFVRRFTGEEIAELTQKHTPEELVHRFLSYAKGTATIGLNDLLPRTVDTFAEESVGYLVTDYFEGESLKTLINSGVKISASSSLKIADQLLKGLKNVHNSGVIFGAISPETLYILKNGEVRLFGLVSEFYDFTDELDFRVEFLNPSYAAPELFDFTTHIGLYSDVYSVAAILYRLLTNTIPAISFLRHGGENLVAPSKIEKSIPHNIQNALLNALNWQFEKRTATPAEFLTELKAEKVKRVRSGAMRWSELLGFFQRLYDKSPLAKNKPSKDVKQTPKEENNSAKKDKAGLLWLWITLPAVVLVGLIIALFLMFPPISENGDSTASTITSSEDVWYYGSGVETPDDSSEYIYGGFSSKKPSQSNSNSSVNNTPLNDPNAVECPDLAGYTLEQAKSVLATSNLLLGEIYYEYSNNYLEGFVMAQSMKSGGMVQKGSRIDLVVCKGPIPVELPNVAGLEMQKATEKLNNAGFSNLEYSFVLSDDAIGVVTDASFETEEGATKDSKVIVTVSGEKAEVSDYLDKTVAEMKGLTSDFVFEFKMQNGNPLPENADLNSYTVVSQSVEKGMPAYKGMTVTITVVTFND